jgi:ribose 5-phosphate isomerase A
MDLVDPVGVEKKLNNLPGVVTCGLWALRPADVVLMASSSGVREF